MFLRTQVSVETVGVGTAPMPIDSAAKRLLATGINPDTTMATGKKLPVPW